jgi:hypothetical protein
VESKCFKKMEALEATMKKQKINMNSSSYNTSSHGHVISASGSPSMQILVLLLMIGLLILEHLIIWINIKPSFLLQINVTLIKYVLAMRDLLVL